MRKFVSVILVICILATVAFSAMAAEEEPTVTPRYSHISSLTGSISINSSGTATCTAQGKGKSATHKVQLNCQLQGYTGSYWSLIKSWSTISTGVASISKTQATSSGYSSYRLQITCKVYDSSSVLLESVTVYKYA